MGYFQVRYNSTVINYDRRGFIRLATAFDIGTRGQCDKISQNFDPSLPFFAFGPILQVVNIIKHFWEEIYVSKIKEFWKVCSDVLTCTKVLKTMPNWSKTTYTQKLLIALKMAYTWCLRLRRKSKLPPKKSFTTLTTEDDILSFPKISSWWVNSRTEFTISRVEWTTGPTHLPNWQDVTFWMDRIRNQIVCQNGRRAAFYILNVNFVCLFGRLQRRLLLLRKSASPSPSTSWCLRYSDSDAYWNWWRERERLNVAKTIFGKLNFVVEHFS